MAKSPDDETYNSPLGNVTGSTHSPSSEKKFVPKPTPALPEGYLPPVSQTLTTDKKPLPLGKIIIGQSVAIVLLLALVAVLLIRPSSASTPGRGQAVIPRATTPGSITEFPLPNSGSETGGITAGPDGNLWFTECLYNSSTMEFHDCTIGRFTPEGSITEFPLPTADRGPYAGPFDITAGPHGTFWFTEPNDNRIGRVTRGGSVTEFTLPTANSVPVGITAGPDGNLWFTENEGSRIGRITSGGSITEFPLPSLSLPLGITKGPDGNLWFTEFDDITGNKIGRITPAGQITEFPLPNPNSSPFDITAGPDGNLWFTENEGNRIGHITPGGRVTEFALPTNCGSSAGCGPDAITAGPDGNLWFTEQFGDKIGRITPGGSITEFALPGGSLAQHITAGPDGNLWFTESGSNWIWRITSGK